MQVLPVQIVGPLLPEGLAQRNVRQQRRRRYWPRIDSRLCGSAEIFEMSGRRGRSELRRPAGSFPPKGRDLIGGTSTPGSSSSRERFRSNSDSRVSDAPTEMSWFRGIGSGSSVRVREEITHQVKAGETDTMLGAGTLGRSLGRMGSGHLNKGSGYCCTRQPCKPSPHLREGSTCGRIRAAGRRADKHACRSSEQDDEAPKTPTNLLEATIR